MSTRKVVIYIFKIFVVLLAREGGEVVELKELDYIIDIYRD